MALQIDTLLTHHKHVGDILTNVRVLNPEKDSAAIATELDKFGKALLAHLALEDKELYPALRAYGDTPGAPFTLKSTIKIFFDEMEQIKPVITGFLGKWNASAIASRPADFKKELGEIEKALNNRIVLEESRLYPLYTDKVREIAATL